MEYGLRRYEAAQRLAWFIYFLLCLTFAYPIASGYEIFPSTLPLNASAVTAEVLRSLGFWSELRWLQVDPMGKVMIFLIWGAFLFLLGRALWLIVQYVGKYALGRLLAANIQRSPGPPKNLILGMTVNMERLFPADLLLRKVNRFPWQLLFHPFRRLRLMLATSQKALSAEELVEKERRIVETDWQILWGSWTPFRWLVWTLPLLGLIQSAWLFYRILSPAFGGQKEFQDLLGPVLTSLLPFVQVIVVTIALNLAAALLKRIENLYLSSVDGMLYDQFLSRLPFQSSDTVVLLETMQRHFQDLQFMLKRIERVLGVGRVEKE